MTDLLLHPQTQLAVDRTIKSGTHGLLLTGEIGAGKYTIARKIVTDLLGANIDSAPYILIVQPDGKAVSIEQIRELQKFLQLKTTGTNKLRRAVIVDEADAMTVEAQNALLKVLEEPPEDTALVLTASRPQRLKPTIHSRVQTMAILPVAKDAAVNYFSKQGFSKTEIEKAYMLSNGQVGLLRALLTDDSENMLITHIETAKELYKMTTFERLTKVDQLSKDRDNLVSLLFACKRICASALEQAALKNQHKAIETWHKQLSLIVRAEESMKYTPNMKLLLTDLFISI